MDQPQKDSNIIADKLTEQRTKIGLNETSSPTLISIFWSRQYDQVSAIEASPGFRRTGNICAIGCLGETELLS